MDTVVRIPACPIHLKEHEYQLCPLHAALDAAFEQLENTYRKLRVIELVDKTVSVESLVKGLKRMHLIRQVKRGRSATAPRTSPEVTKPRPVKKKKAAGKVASVTKVKRG